MSVAPRGGARSPSFPACSSLKMGVNVSGLSFLPPLGRGWLSSGVDIKEVDALFSSTLIR